MDSTAVARPGHLPLTEANMKQLQPSLIQPMSPVSISSDNSDAAAKEEPVDVRITRLRSWVYNVMETLVSLGQEGREVVDADELCIAGPGEVRLRSEDDPSKETPNATAIHYYPARDSTARSPRQFNLKDPKYWEAKLQYFQDKCRPLTQARRKRRRLEPEAAAKEEAARARAAAEAAKATLLAANPNLTPEDLEDAQIEMARIEESRLLWRDKHGRVEKWIMQLPDSPRSFSPMPENRTALLDATLAVPPEGATAYRPPPSSGSSIIEITSAQFKQAVTSSQPRLSEAVTTPVPETSTTNPKKMPAQPLQSPNNVFTRDGHAAGADGPIRENIYTAVAPPPLPQPHPPQNYLLPQYELNSIERLGNMVTRLSSPMVPAAAAGLSEASTATVTPNASAISGLLQANKTTAGTTPEGGPHENGEGLSGASVLLGKRSRDA